MLISCFPVHVLCVALDVCSWYNNFFLLWADVKSNSDSKAKGQIQYGEERGMRQFPAAKHRKVKKRKAYKEIFIWLFAKVLVILRVTEPGFFVFLRNWRLWKHNKLMFSLCGQRHMKRFNYYTCLRRPEHHRLPSPLPRPWTMSPSRHSVPETCCQAATISPAISQCLSWSALPPHEWWLHGGPTERRRSDESTIFQHPQFWCWLSTIVPALSSNHKDASLFIQIG
jgi:hypothetical protein